MHSTQMALKLVALAAAVSASPFALPQGVTSNIAPKESAPAGCKATHGGMFGIAMEPVKGMKRDAPVSQIADGQVQGPVATAPGASGSEYGSGGSSYGVSGIPAVATQIGDGQIQVPTGYPSVVTVIPDGQPQAPVAAPGTGSSGYPSAPSGSHPHLTTETLSSYYTVTMSGDKDSASPAPVVTQIPDGQIQAPTGSGSSGYPSPPATQGSSPSSAPASQTSAPGYSTSSSPSRPSATNAPVASQITDGQIQAPVTKAHHKAHSSHAKHPRKACAGPDDLTMTLLDGVLLDNLGRTGYIAGNRQFQFDKPAQAGAVITAGFTVCDDGMMALGGSKIFYECQSGDFYNLYDQDWAPQCKPVHFKVVDWDC